MLVMCTGAFLGGCSSVTLKALAAADPIKPRTIAVFFDGTHNDEASDTNVKKLHSLVSLQHRDDLSTLYIEGVGTGIDIGGMTTGLGNEVRVRMAYEFLLTQYKPERHDKIYIFGFSRGAYSSRILASLLHHAGLPENPKYTAREISEIVYGAVKQDYSPAEEQKRQQHVDDVLSGKQLARKSVAIEVLGLWDTVEAFGTADWGSKLAHKAGIEAHPVVIDDSNTRYGDQLCNVKNAFHAVSLDDNREWIFTPLLLTRNHLFSKCDPKANVPMLDAQGKIIQGKLLEVWFSGAHSDVGGGYQDSLLSGVSLNWMVQRLAPFGVLPPWLPEKTREKELTVREDAYGSSHNPEDGWFTPVYHAINRDVVGYALSVESRTERSLCVHESVFKRRRAIAPKDHENHQLAFLEPGLITLVKDGRTDLSYVNRLKQAAARDTGAEQLLVQQFPDCRLNNGATK